MDAKILAVALVACAVGLASCNQYPAGVDPRSCPNYPDCDNAALHGFPPTATKSQWNSVVPVPTAENTWNSWGSTSRWNAPAAHAASPRTQYPAGVNPQSSPNYPNCDNVALHGGAFTPHATPGSWESGPAAPWNAAAAGRAPAPAAPQYPARVNTQTCPNYLYC